MNLSHRFQRWGLMFQSLAINARHQVKQAVLWIRFGKITSTVKSIDAGVVSEIEYRGRGNLVIGYWAYGHFDPQGPYQG